MKLGDGPFSGDEWERSFPSKSLEETLGPLRSCAVVTSAGALLNSGLGPEIGKHHGNHEHSVLTFNWPTLPDVLLTLCYCTKLVVLQWNKFFRSPDYKTGTLIVWDPAPYSKNLTQKPDFKFFKLYQQYRKLFPEQPFYILGPAFHWNLWDVIQDNSVPNIVPNPPSTGMQGIAVMMNLCEKVSVYEFLPSHRRTSLCHYYEKHRSWSCTVGSYHPMKFEKLLIGRINQGSDEDIAALGKVTLNGLSQEKCPEKCP
uniref:Beta-galactoside alpha-2,6-sialyltransferase 1 n=1 Tax=Denticeps clupeoides TaxID=299321 RepID=A0AAY4DGI6_9TELE